jgi:hypothetical protein
MYRSGLIRLVGRFLARHRRNFNWLVLTLTGAVIAACGGGGGSDAPAAAPPAASPDSQGVFIDSAVAGLDYTTASTEGVTDAAGVFYFDQGEAVSFAIGRLRIGSADAASLLSPLDLVPANAGTGDPRVTALASLLQSLDLDGDPANGINISSAVKSLVDDALGTSDLDLGSVYALTGAELATALADLDALVQAVVASATATGLALSYVSPAEAGEHLLTTLSTYLATVSPAFDPAWAPAGAFTNASSCARCHAARDGETALRDDQGHDISPSHDWQHGVMAHAFDDPYFQAVLNEESTHEFPHFAGLIEDRCLNCHAPMGYAQAHTTGTGLDADGFYRLGQATLDMHAREGVSCTLCHQIEATDVDSASRPVVGEDADSGEFNISSARIVYGPFGDASETAINTGPMQTNVNYTPQFGSQTRDSGLCASCHTVRTPVMDITTGNPAQPARQFLEQGPYFEWLNSVYTRGGAEERHCQDCHMPVPADGYTTPIATRPPGQPERGPYRRHTFLGGNAWLLELLQEFRAVLGIEATTTESGFDEAIADKRDFMRAAAAELAIDRIARSGADALEVDVRVINHGGHKLPTSYPSRRVWIHLRVVHDTSGTVIFESGAPSADGRISTDAAHLDVACLATLKADNFDSGACYEPHRDVIDSASQIAIYEAVLADTEDRINHVLLYAGGYLKDNRIPPRGFTAAGVIDDTAVAGVGSDPDFNVEAGSEGSGSDRVHYRVALGQLTGPLTVEAALLYQAVRPTFIDALHADSAPVNRLKLMTRMLPPAVETLATASAALP